MRTVPTSVLPVQLREALISLGSKLQRRQSVEGEFERTLQWLHEIPASAVVKAEREISYATQLYEYGPRVRRGWFVAAEPNCVKQLERLPGLEYLYIFHRDGRIREAALKKIASGLPSPFLVAAVVWRLNDWALPVRVAAVECAKRVFPLTSGEAIAQAAVVLLPRENSWRRWTNERALLVDMVDRADVARSLAHILRDRETGGITTVFRLALRQRGLDSYLEELAKEAIQPAVRAVALQSLIECYANWPSRLEWRWVDKSMGVRRRVTVFERRTLTQNVSRKPLIIMGAADRSAALRKVALDGLIRYRAEIPEAKHIGERLLRDHAASVRERAEFLVTTIAAAQ
jgi:hypothetical protein